MGDYHVVLYTSPQCEDCRDAKAFLEGKGIQYEEKSIQDPASGENWPKRRERPIARLSMSTAMSW